MHMPLLYGPAQVVSQSEDGGLYEDGGDDVQHAMVIQVGFRRR